MTKDLLSECLIHEHQVPIYTPTVPKQNVNSKQYRLVIHHMFCFMLKT